MKDSFKCFINKKLSVIPSATEWTNKHTTSNNNKYKKDTLVWFDNYIYKCLIDNSGADINNTFFWEKVTPGFRLSQEQSDWLSNEGVSKILNKPTKLSDFINDIGGTSYIETDPIFQSWLSGNPLFGYLTINDANNTFQPLGNYASGLGSADGVNTGDETTLSIQTKRPLKTIEGQSIEGIGNIDLAIPTQVSDLANDSGFITTETDPIFQASEASLFTTGDKAKLDNQNGVNTGDNAPNSNYASDYRASNFIADTDYLTPNTANNLFDFKPVVYNKTTNLPIIGSATINNVEGLSIIASGPVARNFADTNLFTRTQRLGLITSTTGNSAQIRQTSLYFSGNTGYEVIFKFGFSENATDTAIRAFIGLSTNTGVFSNVEPDTLLNCIGFCRLSTSNNLHLIHNDNTGIATTIDLGSNFPANTINTDVYLVKFVTIAGSNSVSVYIERQNTGHIYTATLTTDIPALSQGLNFGGYIVDTTGANTSTGIDFMGMYVKN